MINICMVGTGRMSVAHSKALSAMKGAALHTVINRRAEYAQAFADEYGYQAIATSLEQALAQGGFDAVVVCTPNQLHVEQSAVALRAGKHVLCEIPSALSLPDAEMLGQLAAERGLRMMSCHTERFEAGRMDLAQRIQAAELHPRHIIARFYMLRHGHLITQQQHHGWYDNVLWHHGCHTIDAIMHMLGSHEPKDLAVQVGPRWETTDAPLDWSLQWVAPSPLTGQDVLVSMTLSHNAASGHHDYRILADEGEYVSQRGTLRDHEGKVLVVGDGAGWVDRQDAEFVTAVREGRQASLDMPAVLPTMRILQAAWDQYLAKQS